MTDEAFQKAQAYNQAVVGIGYAGIFALLSYTHGDLIPQDRAIAAGALLASLTVFVVWVVGEMVWSTCVALRVVRKRELRPSTLAGLWITALSLTIIPAGSAAFIMFRAYWRMLF